MYKRLIDKMGCIFMLLIMQCSECQLQINFAKIITFYVGGGGDLDCE